MLLHLLTTGSPLHLSLDLMPRIEGAADTDQTSVEPGCEAGLDPFRTLGGAHLGSWRPEASLRLPCKVPSELFKFSSLPGSKLVGAQLDLDLS